MEELVSDVADAVNVKLQKKNNVELVTHIDPNIPPVILGDSVRLRQVLLNLTDNAAKFTEEGEVHLFAKMVTKLPYGIIIRFAVKDSGIGMTDEQAWTCRIGVHSGEVIAGIVGKSRFIYDILGDSVNIAARVESNGTPMKVTVTHATKSLIESGFQYESKGNVMLKGKGEMELFLAEKVN